MQMKYFQGIGSILHHYEEILRHFNHPSFGHSTLESWEINLTEKEDIIQEREVLRYLIGCQQSFVRVSNIKKPSIAIVQRCFQRHLSYLNSIQDCHAYNVNTHENKYISIQYKTCRHYLFKFSLDAWYEKLPDELLTLEEKYGI